MYIHTETKPALSQTDPHTLLLNIETTGLSARTAFIYMIGMQWQEKDVLISRCLLADSRMDERLLLETLYQQLKDINRIITYGGHSFSFRFLTERWSNYYDEDKPLFDDGQLEDLQKAIAPHKAVLSLPDLKKSTLEQFVGYHRKTPPSGKELIHVFAEWERSHTENFRDQLLAHHSDDLNGLTYLLNLQSYIDFWHGCFKEAPLWQLQNDHCVFQIKPTGFIPKAIQYRTDFAHIILDPAMAVLTVPVMAGRLKHFLPGPVKDYYYLPAEDQAIHRSVGCYVDKAYRKKATAATCYTACEGIFLPSPPTDAQPCFREDYQSPYTYILYDPDQWQRHPEILRLYLQSILS